MATSEELAAMRLAIALSANGLATTSPNPPVGCVVLDAAGTVVGTGFHRRKGEPHAERYALELAGDRAERGTAVVTLEPCNHVGRTPACHQGLLDAGVRRVVVALIDPTSRREGGVALLRAAGIEVETGVLADEARIVIGPWLASLAAGRPRLTAVLVDSDGSASLVREERWAFDAVVLPSGAVEEGVAGSHGTGAIALPTVDIDVAPLEAVDALYAGGVRSLLVEATRARLDLLRSVGCLDNVVLFQRVDEPAAVPDGLKLVRAERRAEVVRLELVPMPSSAG